MAHAENDGAFVAVHPCRDCALLEGACAALRVEKINMQLTGKLFLRHNGREALTSCFVFFALTSWLDISTWTSSRHFSVNMVGSEHILSQTCSSGVFDVSVSGPEVLA
ncbi:unnamed protein product [Rangifer tarandus platyrhynchus]|uniref:Uncharacterized protein n=1 Tax=Rangifer tarandus platyrhynchus TaxID=3082113 RepID=A0AC59ZDJ8_RANTA